MLALLADPQWQPYLVFPGELVAAELLRTATKLIAARARFYWATAIFDAWKWSKQAQQWAKQAISIVWHARAASSWF